MAGGKVRKIDFSPDEFIAGTVGMSPEELGVYWLICSLIYSTGEAIPQDDERLRALRCNPRTTRKVVDQLVERGKIEIGPNGEMMVKRCRKELERSSERMRKAAESGSKGGRPPKETSPEQEDTKPNGLSTEKLSPPPPPSSLEDTRVTAGVIPFPSPEERQAEPRQPEELGNEFAVWYAACPLKKAPARARKAYRAALKRPGVSHALLLARIRDYAAEVAGTDPRYIAHPATWLNDERYLDQRPQAPKRKFQV